MQPLMQKRKQVSVKRESGFSLIEMLVVMAVITVIMGSVFKSINLTQQKSRSEQIKLDLTEQAREFVDQLTRDLRNAGYPYQRNMANTLDPANVAYNFVNATDPYNAPGLIYISNNSLWFAANLDGTTGAEAGTAKVEIVRYDYVAAGANEPNCPCLRRTEFLRNGGDPLADAKNLGNNVQQLEIQNVQNGTAAANAIFTVYDDTGAAIALPIDFDNNAVAVASINSLKVVLSVQSTQQDTDKSFPVTTVISSIALTNCSEALGNGGTPNYCQ